MNDRRYWEKTGSNYTEEVFNVAANDRRGIIRREIRRASGAFAADMGCGIGNFLPLLSARFQHVNAIDFSAACLRECRSTHATIENVSYLRKDLRQTTRHFKPVDFILSVNALLSPRLADQLAMFHSLARHLKKNGTLLLVVPSVESAMLADHRFTEWCLRTGTSPAHAQRIANGAERREDLEIASDGIVKIAGSATKHYLREEIQLRLESLKFNVRSIRKLDYAWDTEFEEPPKWMQEPYPWDWCVVATKG
tara:strand:- start:169 stop:924 length:756 start_codon:yes stop_codon:yes gene_type:complete